MAIFRQHRSDLMPPIHQTPTNIGITLISPQTRVSALHTCRWWYGSIFTAILVMSSKRQVHNVSELLPFKVIQGHQFWYQSKAPVHIPISGQ